MKYTSLKINNKEGNFYTTAKTQLDDSYIQNNYDVAGRKGTNYQKFFDKIEGTLHSVDIYTAEKLEGTPQLLRINVNSLDGNEAINLDIPLLDSKGKWLNDWVCAVAPTLGALNVGEKITISLNNKAVDSKGFLYKNIYVRVWNEDTQTYDLPAWSYHPKNDVPSWVVTVVKHKVTKKEMKEVDKEAHDGFIYDKVEEALMKLKPVAKTSNSPAVSSAPKANVPAAKAEAVIGVVEEEDDDFDDSLPF